MPTKELILDRYQDSLQKESENDNSKKDNCDVNRLCNKCYKIFNYTTDMLFESYNNEKNQLVKAMESELNLIIAKIDILTKCIGEGKFNIKFDGKSITDDQLNSLVGNIRKIEATSFKESLIEYQTHHNRANSYTHKGLENLVNQKNQNSFGDLDNTANGNTRGVSGPRRGNSQKSKINSLEKKEKDNAVGKCHNKTVFGKTLATNNNNQNNSKPDISNKPKNYTTNKPNSNSVDKQPYNTAAIPNLNSSKEKDINYNPRRIREEYNDKKRPAKLNNTQQQQNKTEEIGSTSNIKSNKTSKITATKTTSQIKKNSVEKFSKEKRSNSNKILKKCETTPISIASDELTHNHVKNNSLDNFNFPIGNNKYGSDQNSRNRMAGIAFSNKNNSDKLSQDIANFPSKKTVFKATNDSPQANLKEENNNVELSDEFTQELAHFNKKLKEEFFKDKESETESSYKTSNDSFTLIEDFIRSTTDSKKCYDSKSTLDKKEGLKKRDYFQQSKDILHNYNTTTNENLLKENDKKNLIELIDYGDDKENTKNGNLYKKKTGNGVLTNSNSYAYHTTKLGGATGTSGNNSKVHKGLFKNLKQVNNDYYSTANHSSEYLKNSEKENNVTTSNGHTKFTKHQQSKNSVTSDGSNFRKTKNEMAGDRYTFEVDNKLTNYGSQSQSIEMDNEDLIGSEQSNQDFTDNSNWVYDDDYNDIIKYDKKLNSCIDGVILEQQKTEESFKKNTSTDSEKPYTTKSKPKLNFPKLNNQELINMRKSASKIETPHF